jgi:hypothetical protein
VRGLVLLEHADHFVVVLVEQGACVLAGHRFSLVGRQPR